MQSGDAHRPTSTSVARFLAERGWHTAPRVTRLGHGEWSRAFTFAASDASEYVIRFSTVDDDFRKDALAAHFAAPNLTIKPILELGTAFDGYYAIAERARGAYLDELSGQSLLRALPSVFAALDAMRDADVSPTSGFGLWDASGDARHAAWRDALLDARHDPRGRIVGWRRALEQSPTGAEPFDAAISVLERLAADAPETRHLVHSDLLNYNVLVDRTHVSAVLDWGSSMYGDWLWDLAWLVFWQPWYPAWCDIDFVTEAQRHFASIGLSVPDFATRLRACSIAIGLDNQTYCAFKGPSRWQQLAEVAQRTLLFASA